eukprot:TRINITY_DN11683_c0_g1_i1.p1 TRINITY_DN11683_c0_g1~~TRINITY_DN11683_c0_g1_i1.p1  ORF type:complete len:752 (+),score=85.65 TRINITY_DN11683_c0_g1_i1:46-2301(+)
MLHTTSRRNEEEEYEWPSFYTAAKKIASASLPEIRIHKHYSHGHGSFKRTMVYIILTMTVIALYNREKQSKAVQVNIIQTTDQLPPVSLPAVPMIRTTAKTSKKHPVSPMRLRICLNSDPVITSNVTIWSFPNPRDSGSIDSLELLIRKAKQNTDVAFSAFLIELIEDALPIDHKLRLQAAGWTFCTIRRLGSPREQFNLALLWEVPVKTAVYISPNAYISGSITPLLTTELPNNTRIGATLDYDEETSSWKSSFNTGVFVIHPNQKDHAKIKTMLKTTKISHRVGEGFSTLLNILWVASWYEIGFQNAANVALFRSEPLFWNSRLYDLRIIHYTKELPWQYEVSVEPANWWKDELSNKDFPSSLYHKLWRNMGVGTFGTATATPLQYSPDPTPDPLPRETHKKALVPATQDPDTLRIYTEDRRSSRIQRRIMDIHRDIFPDDAPANKQWIIALGIPSIDTAKGQILRELQRKSCFSYDTVWNYKRRDDAQVIVKYLLAYHPENNYTITQRLIDEAQITQDIVFFNLREGKPAESGEQLFERKPLAILVGMSRKIYAWFCYVADRINTDYAIKGDDDAFFRVKLLLNELASYRFPRVYYGRGLIYSKLKGSFRTDGPLVALSYDLVDWVRDSKIAESYTDFAFEDVLPTIWMWEANLQANNISDCRVQQFNHDIRHYTYNGSILIHGFRSNRPAQFFEYRKRFSDDHVKPLKIQTQLRLVNGEFVQFNERDRCPQTMIDRLLMHPNSTDYD